MRMYLPMLVLAGGLPLSAQAVDMGDFGPRAGDHEFTLSGAGTSNKDFDRGSLGLSLSYGRYITDNWQWAIRQGVNFADLANDNMWNGSTRLAADYHWNLGKWRPLAGLQVGYVYGDGVNDTGVIGPEIGIKYYAKPDTFVYFLEEYQFFFKDAEDINDNFDNGAFVHTLGIGYNF